MTQRTQIYLPADEHRRARLRASELGISMAEYVRRLVHRDLQAPEAEANVDALFGLGDSGGSDVAAHKDAYLADAFADEDTDRR